VLIDDLVRETRDRERIGQPRQLNLFADFNGLPNENARTEFYQHDANWSNRMILGDSLQVMASLAEREGLRGKVQCIYIDPPYGIKFNSNFQWSTTSRDVKDGNTEHITREPEQVKAFRDTWRDGVHSYLTYLRDRLTIARDLLASTGSLFLQMSDENIHRLRTIMDEVFGERNYVATILYRTTGGFATTGLSRIGDNILWYARSLDQAKIRHLYSAKSHIEDKNYRFLEDESYISRSMTKAEQNGYSQLPHRVRVFRCGDSTGQGVASDETPLELHGNVYYPPRNTHWKANYPVGMHRLAKANRLIGAGKTLSYKRYFDDHPVKPINSAWLDTGVSGFASDKNYVVETLPDVAQRCVLLVTDPGDLVLDPTCGSGTTAYVAEQWGRRWITIDTSRVALALARARIMGARYPYYLLADSRDGQLKEAELTRKAPSEAPTHGNIRQGFVYERVPHITLKTIANNAEIDVIWENFQEVLEPLREQLNRVLSDQWSVVSKGKGAFKPLEEWEIPRAWPESWPPATQSLYAEWWKQRIARQREIDASIAAKAGYEFLYDRPYEDKKKVRVSGPFTVESISPHRVLAVDEDDELIDSTESKAGNGGELDFARMILENLRTAGVQQAHKEDKIHFTSITPWPGHYVCAEGTVDSGEWLVVSEKRQATNHKPLTTPKRAAIFIGPEFGTVSRPDLVAAAREAGDADFDALIACAFNYDGHSTGFDKLGRIPVLKARMNADLHMADDLKNTGKGNLFVIFGEPDIEVVSGQWLVTSDGRMVAHYDSVTKLSGLGSLEEINRLGGESLSSLKRLSPGREVRTDQPGPKGSGVSIGEHSGGRGEDRDGGISPGSERSGGVPGGSGDTPDSGASVGAADRTRVPSPPGGSGRTGADAQWTKTVAALQTLRPKDFPLTLTTNHYTQITILGVDVFHPNTGEVRSDGAEGIACWFIDTDYNEESFFVRHAYFLGASDPYKSLKTTLKAEINQEAWESLHSDTSRPFNKPASGRIAVKVINHLGDEVMKVFRVE
jgi:adenine-specific DNA-methyltransferase